MPGRIVSFKDLTSRREISVSGTGKFLIGLALDGNLIIAEDEQEIGVLLLYLEVLENGGCTVCGADKDLACIVNSNEQLSGEINLINGTRLEIADITLVFIDGPIPKLRRKLPRTPGMGFGDAPPAKPVRHPTESQDNQHSGLTEPADHSLSVTSVDPETSDDPRDEVDALRDGDNLHAGSEERRWLESSWCMLELPVPDQEMFRGLDTPEKVGILAASYLCKQVRIFTDAMVTTQQLDDIFKMCLETVDQCYDVYMDYLSDISKLLARIPDHSNSQPMHGPAIIFLAHLLTHSLDPVCRVVLILDLLRTFSHFDVNLYTMVRYQTTAAVLGSMAAFLDVVEVQQYCMEILAKIATYKPRLDRKEPLRDVGIDLVVRGMQHHRHNIELARAGCRVLANLSSTLLTATNQLLDSGGKTDAELVASAVDRYEALLLYVFEHGIPAVQAVLKEFRTDLGISTEGRRFIFYYAKLPQLQMKKSKLGKDHVTSSSISEDDPHVTEGELESSNQHEFEESCDPSCDQAKFLRKASFPEPEVPGILKNTGCYENLKNGDKRIAFADDTVGGSDSESYTSESESEAELVRSFEASVDLDKATSETFSSKVRHVMKRTIKRQKSFHGEVNPDESDTDESSFMEELVSEDIERPGVQEEDSCKDDAENSRTSADIQNLSDKTEPSGNVLTTTAAEKETSVEVDESKSSKSKPLQADKSDHVKDTVYRTVSIDQDFVLIEGSDEKTDTLSPVSQTNNTAPQVLDAGSLSKDTDGGSLSKDIPKPDSDREAAVSADEKEISQIIQHSTEKEVPQAQHKTKEVAKTTTRKEDVIDVFFFGKLVRTQIIIYVGSLVFQEEDSKVLLIIDQPIKPLLEEAGAPSELVKFAGSQYGPEMTLMDLEPAIVINIIDAVRYRSVTKDLVQSAVLGLTRSMFASLQQVTVTTTMLFFKAMFADVHLQSVLTGEEFLAEFRTCFKNATQRLEKSHTLEEIRKTIAEKNFVV